MKRYFWKFLFKRVTEEDLERLLRKVKEEKLRTESYQIDEADKLVKIFNEDKLVAEFLCGVKQ